jgi:hypothetical protein
VDVHPASAVAKSANSVTPASTSQISPATVSAAVASTYANRIPESQFAVRHTRECLLFELSYCGFELCIFWFNQVGDYCLSEIDGDRVPCRIVALVRADDDTHPESDQKQLKPKHPNQEVCGYFVVMCEDGINGVRFFVETHHCFAITSYPIGCQVSVIIPEVSHNKDALSVDVDDVNVQFDSFGPDVQPGIIVDCSNGVYSVQLSDLPLSLTAQPWQIMRP